MAKTLRVGMIGSGGNARHHMGSLLKLKGAKIVGITDTSEDALAKAVEQHPSLKGVPTFSDHKEMLEKVDMDAVEISTPHVHHYQQIIDALDHGLHVLTEKPMVCTTKQARSVVRKVKSTGLVMGVSYQRHFAGAYRYCREKIASGEIGPVHFVTALQSQQWYRGQVERHTWRSQMQYACGGQLNDSGSHLVDIILWMVGAKPKKVFAFENNMKAEVDILTAMSVEFKGGALANISVVGHAVNWLEDITLWCDKGTLAIRGSDVQEWDEKGQMTVHAAADLPNLSTPDANFLAAINGKEEIQAPPECGVDVIRLTEAAWKSAELGEPVDVPKA